MPPLTIRYNIIREQFPEVHVLASKKNAGFCISNNRMVEYAHGKYILLLNNDAILRPGSLRAFLLDTEASATIPGIIGLPQYSLADGTLVDRGYEFDLFMNPIPAFVPAGKKLHLLPAHASGYHAKYGMRLEASRTGSNRLPKMSTCAMPPDLLGYPVVVLAAPGFDHWIGRNLGGGKVMEKKLVSTTRRRALSERNKTWVMMICYPLPVLLLILPLHFALLATRGYSTTGNGHTVEQR